MHSISRRPVLTLALAWSAAPTARPTPRHPAHAAAPAHGGPPGRYAERADVRAWAYAQVQPGNPLAGWEASAVLAHLAHARYQRTAAQLILPAPKGVAKNWGAYRDRFIEPRRVQAGLRFWALHAGALSRAQAQFGVPAELVLGILGVETFYGQILGDFRVVDVLSTLAFDFPRGRSDRSPFFREQLAEFLLLASAQGRDPTDFKGSFAGAMGLGQFMPSSWRAHALDFDGDTRINLSTSAADAIGSVANFLHRHGWTPGMPTHLPAMPPPDPAMGQALLAGDIEPQWDRAGLESAGLAFAPEQRPTLDQHGPWAFVQLENGTQAPPTHVLASRNFWVVTRYNRSAYYALAVISLSERLRQLRQAELAPK